MFPRTANRAKRAAPACTTSVSTPNSLVADVCDTTTLTVSCHHHQAIAKLGDGLRVTGRAADGIVEALELDGSFVLAVQWHPEDTAEDDPAQQRLFDALVRKAESA